MLIISAVLFLIAVLLPEAAYAWGPATHLELGSSILHHTQLIAPGVRALIEAYPFDYLYGNISADIVVGKNLVEELKHCHNWKIGFKLLKKAAPGSQQAFAYGYLSHLAADTIAHNHYIPEMMIRNFSARTLRHIYWEMRFDNLVDRKVWQLPKKMVKEVHRDNDRLLDSIIEDTPLSFRTNKSIFSSIMSLNRFDHWHRMLGVLSNSSRWKLERYEKDKFVAASLETILELLTHGHKAACVKKDPTGKHTINAAKFIRRRLANIKGQDKDWQNALDNALKWVRL